MIWESLLLRTSYRFFSFPIAPTTPGPHDCSGCRMKAYRFVQVVCKQCGKHACASYAESYTTEAVRQEAVRRAWTFVGWVGGGGWVSNTTFIK